MENNLSSYTCCQSGMAERQLRDCCLLRRAFVCRCLIARTVSANEESKNEQISSVTENEDIGIALSEL